ncbi:hypothetical protein [Humibacillus xanthopallidus]|uniref:Uncharacterized protein n=1 Tax=Humibacillus xanthopallidus TaxID=412689 RepID=A0A543HUD9_9MICO|nr:hypothetical protein [Humibacillus xanthopallidus]TQM61938.1 hypothetical protein FBY41_1960 [Humibacillus xanthopallidus]
MSDPRLLTAEDLLAGTATVHEVVVPAHVLRPGDPTERSETQGGPGLPGAVRLRPLTVGTLVLISRAARDDPSLVPLLLVKESMVEPAMSLDELRRLHAGLIHFLVSKVNTISGLSPSGDVLDDAVSSPVGQVHILLARHFGWSPDQVARLTPGQVAVYLAGVDALFDNAERPDEQAGPPTEPFLAGLP